MSTETTTAPVRKTTFVRRPREDAIRLFTEGIAAWWPVARHPIAPGEDGLEAETVVFEPREGGLIYERRRDGSIERWGEVTVWEPPRRFVIAWRPNPESPAPTEVEVTFTPDGEGTRVDLEHRGWERLGDDAEVARMEYEAGWDGVLGRYAGAGGENGLAIAAFVLGIASLVVPLAGVIGAVFAIVFGLIGRRRAARGARHGGLATAGLALGLVALLVWILVALVVGLGVGASQTEIQGPIEPAPSP